jgi:ADP-ribose pyrophosphatase YjhB (NUDIX family)
MVVYKGRVFSVEVENVVLRNGREVELSIVRHRPSVVLIPVQDDGQIVIIRQYRHALGRDIWELPAGNVDEGESAEAAAARECEEEIGEVPTRIDRLGSFYPTPGYCDEEMIFFRVSGLQPPPQTHFTSPTTMKTCRPGDVAAQAKAGRARRISTSTARAHADRNGKAGQDGLLWAQRPICSSIAGRRASGALQVSLSKVPRHQRDR